MWKNDWLCTTLNQQTVCYVLAMLYLKSKGADMPDVVFKTLFILYFILLSGCNPSQPDKLKIVANAWIGYSPLFYAKEKGWLDPLGIKLVNVVSLGESLKLYQVGGADAFTGTQYEYGQVHDRDSSVIPIILFDRSNGGDMVMSNKSLNYLKDSTKEIDVYLEMDSINQVILQDFLTTNELKNKKLTYINKDQAEISTLFSTPESGSILIVTYSPYDSTLKKNGFFELANTRDSHDLLVLDGLYATQANFIANKNRFVQLKKIIDQAVNASGDNPQEYFNLVNPYLGNITYQEFNEGIKGIVWLNKSMSPEIAGRINDAGFPTSDLIP